MKIFSIIGNLWSIRGYIAEILAIIASIKTLVGSEQVKAILTAIADTVKKIKEEMNNTTPQTLNASVASEEMKEPIKTDIVTKAVAMRMLGISEKDYCEICKANKVECSC